MSKPISPLYQALPSPQPADEGPPPTFKEAMRSIRKKSHYRAPMVMFVALFAGLAFALVHHFFYLYWDQKAVASDDQQRWIVRGGTGFAFGFKAALTIGSGAAYVQYLWMSIRKRPYQVGDLDSLFSALRTVSSFADVRLWARVPLLLTMALTTWFIPFAAIVTPGTLVVSPTLRSQISQQLVPLFDFENKADAYGILGLWEGFGDQFVQATNDLLRTSVASATSGSISTIPPPAPNSSYNVHFFGPALDCVRVPDADMNAVSKIISNDSNASGAYQIRYLAWVPTPPNSSSDTATIRDVPSFEKGIPSLGPIDLYAGRGSSPGEKVFLWSWLSDFATHTSTADQYPSVITCTLHNVSYTVDFVFNSGQQHLAIQTGPKNDPVSQLPTEQYGATFAQVQNYTKIRSYLSLMYAFGNLVTGSITEDDSYDQFSSSTMINSTGVGPLLGTGTNETIARGLEELFQNITFSLLNEPRYLQSGLNATIAPVNVTRSENVYVYRPLDLYLSYGIALLCNIICLLVGCFALLNNGVSFTSDFSTILRATRKRELDRLVVGNEFSGAGSSSRQLAQTWLQYNLTDDRTAGFQRSPAQEKT